MKPGFFTVAIAGTALCLRLIFSFWGNKTPASPNVCTKPLPLPLPPKDTVGLSLVLQLAREEGQLQQVQVHQTMQALAALRFEVINEGEEGVKVSELVEMSDHDCLLGGRGSDVERVEVEEGSKRVVVSDQDRRLVGGADPEDDDQEEDVIVIVEEPVEVVETIELRDENSCLIARKNSDDLEEEEEAYLIDGREDYVFDDKENYQVDDGEGYVVDAGYDYQFECGEDYVVDGGEIYIIGQREAYEDYFDVGREGCAVNEPEAYEDYLAVGREGCAVDDGKSVDVSEESVDGGDVDGYLVDGENVEGCVVDGGNAKGCQVDGGVVEGCLVDDVGNHEYEEEDIEGEVPYEAFKDHTKLKDFEVFVGGLNRDTSEADLVQVFNQVGTLTQVRLIMNPVTKKNKGYAFLRFKTVDQAKRAILELRNPMVFGRPCTVGPSHECVPNRSKRFPHPNPSYGGISERDCIVRKPSCGTNVKRPQREKYSSSRDTYQSVRRPYSDENNFERPSLIDHKYYDKDNYRYSYQSCAVRDGNLGNRVERTYRGYHGSRSSRRQYSTSQGFNNRGSASNVGHARCFSNLGSNYLSCEPNVGGSLYPSIHSGRDLSWHQGGS